MNNLYKWIVLQRSDLAGEVRCDLSQGLRAMRQEREFSEGRRRADRRIITYYSWMILKKI